MHMEDGYELSAFVIFCILFVWKRNHGLIIYDLLSLASLGNMPEEYAKYYGFTRFAIELNEISPGLKEKLPVTDTR